MSYLEEQRIFYEQFPTFFLGVVVGAVGLIILYKLFQNKRFVRVFCRMILLIPALLVVLVLHITKYHS